MNVTKRNGKVVLYDTRKIIDSIMKASQEAPLEDLSSHTASYIADEVFSRLTKAKEIITTNDIRDAVYALLREMGFFQTADRYISYEK